MSSEIKVVTTSKSGLPLALWILTLVLFLVETGLYVRERGLRQKAEDKMRQALLLLNDERGQSMDSLKSKVETEASLAVTKQERDKALAETNSLLKAKQQLEFDNLEKEKKVSGMSKEIHDLQMKNLELTEKIKASAAPAAVEPAAATVKS